MKNKRKFITNWHENALSFFPEKNRLIRKLCEKLILFNLNAKWKNRQDFS